MTIKVGDIITFTNEINTEDFDEVDTGIMARVTNIEPESDDPDVIKVCFDISEFESQNKNKWSAGFYDFNHNPSLTYPETRHYTPKISYYFMRDVFEAGKIWEVTSDVVMHDDTKSVFWAMLIELESNCGDADVLKKNLVEQAYAHWNRVHILQTPKFPRWKTV